MPDLHDDGVIDNDNDTGYTLEADWPHRAVPTVALLSGALLAACGGGGSSPGTVTPPPPPPPTPPTATEAARFLAQASMGITHEHIAKVQSLGYAGWLDEQFALPVSGTRWNWLIAGGYNVSANMNTDAGADACQWRKLLSAPDTLRQRVTLALSEILVAAIAGFEGAGWKTFSAAAYLDLLEANAFGNYRTLLQQVSLSAPMGEFLTYRGNVKFNATTGASPDENYAREVMQLFTIGLLQLNLDGTPKLTGGQPTETYTLDDITGLARVFTGWNYDLAGATTATPDFKARPMTQIAARHESGAKSFLGTTIAAGTNGLDSLTQALDAIFAHANVGPFISRQLIQRLVCSNPSPAYVARVATVFNNDGAGVKGNLKAVCKAILLDTEARGAGGLSNPNFGKLREPILRFTAWARAFKASSPSDAWGIGNTSDPGNRLGQSPLRSSTVFNFFRPGYVPPNSAIGSAALVAPEFQITNESTVVGYVNYMQLVVKNGAGDVKGDYATLLPLADTAQALLDELNLLLAAGQLSPATVALIKGALESMPSGTDSARLNRIYAALVLVMAAPEFIVQK
ncbi:MAG: DUF1800 domain-containing protein [Pseudomonadota bacterium]